MEGIPRGTEVRREDRGEIDACDDDEEPRGKRGGLPLDDRDENMLRVFQWKIFQNNGCLG
jgi:hypothetical protein